MAIPRTSIRNFLISAKKALHNALNGTQRVNLVIGNESADLDSISSSLVYAYIRSSLPPPSAFSPVYVPITNIPAKDISLRPELIALLPHADLEPQLLITLDDLATETDLRRKLPPERTRWILVDHNSLQGLLGSIYSGRVGGVIDHHDDEGKVPSDTGDEPHVIEKSGSCSSLVVNYCQQAWESLSGIDGRNKSEITLWDAQVAKLALASVLIDTVNMTEKSKVTKHDENALRYLESKINRWIEGRKGDRLLFDRDGFYEQIRDAKEDIGGLILHDILRKDYKEWNSSKNKKLGVASVVKSLDFLVDKAASEDQGSKPADAFINSVREFADQRKLSLVAIMTTFNNPEGHFTRELFVWALEVDVVPAAQKFQMISGGELQLEGWDDHSLDLVNDTGNQWRMAWYQRALQHSRKRVAPMLREALG